MKQKEHIGGGSLEKLSDILSTHSPPSILLVTGNKSYELSGAAERLESILSPYNCTRFCGFAPNPKLKDIESGLHLFTENACDLIIAVGGGTAMDIAKTIGSIAANPGTAREYVSGDKTFTLKGVPLIAIPTTAGSGSEATQFAVLYIDGVKYSIAHEFLLPAYSIVDYTLTDSMSPDLTAVFGLDALAQAIESYWAVGSTDESKSFAAKAIPMILANLESAVNSPSSASREAMMLGANLAGKAINISRTTACHAMSYIMTTTLGIPHGHAVALTLPSMIVYNSELTEDDIVDPRGVAYVKETMSSLLSILSSPPGGEDQGEGYISNNTLPKVSTPEEASDMIISLMGRVGVSPRFSDLGMPLDELGDLIAGSINWERMRNNPRALSEERVRNLVAEDIAE